MRKQIIEYYAHQFTRIPFDDCESFQFRKDKPAYWLQKICIFIMKKLGAYRIGESVEIQRHVIDADEFMEKLFMQMENMESFFNMKPDVLLIGSDDYAKLMKEDVTGKMFSFSAEYGYNQRIYGLKVKVIPWMSGCLVMP